MSVAPSRVGPEIAGGVVLAGGIAGGGSADLYVTAIPFQLTNASMLPAVV